MNFDCIIGIDPGASGGVAYTLNGKTTAIKMAKDLSNLVALVQHLKSVSTPIAFIERLSIRPDDVFVSGGNANMGKLFRIQKMMQNFEQLKAVFDVCGVPYCLVSPMKWQQGWRKKGEEKAERKRRFKIIASELFPTNNITLWNADALLIMRFGELSVENDAKWIREHINTKNNSLFE